MTGADRVCRGRLESLTHQLSAIADAETRLITVPKTKTSHALIFKLATQVGLLSGLREETRLEPLGILD